VLVVDDDESILLLVQRLLEAIGYPSIGAGSAAEALELARRERPDAVLMDVQMPEVGGFEAVAMIRAEPGLERLPILALTALVLTPEQVQEGRFDGYLRKPVELGKLGAELAPLLGTGESV